MSIVSFVMTMLGMQHDVWSFQATWSTGRTFGALQFPYSYGAHAQSASLARERLAKWQAKEELPVLQEDDGRIIELGPMISWRIEKLVIRFGVCVQQDTIEEFTR